MADKRKTSIKRRITEDYVPDECGKAKQSIVLIDEAATAAALQKDDADLDLELNEMGDVDTDAISRLCCESSSSSEESEGSPAKRNCVANKRVDGFFLGDEFQDMRKKEKIQQEGRQQAE